MILKCSNNCGHAHQDQLYGVGMRVHNAAKKLNGFRCTVCGNLVIRKSSAAEEKAVRTAKPTGGKKK